MNNIIKYENIESRIIVIRGQKMLLDSDVADLYGVETKRINEAVKNNPDKFPEGYIVFLTENEKDKLVEIFDRFNTLKHSTVIPKAFTEKRVIYACYNTKKQSSNTNNHCHNRNLR